MSNFRTNALDQAFSYVNNQLGAISTAAHLYQTARNWGRIHRLRSVLTGKSHRLFSLEAVQATCNVRGRHYTGVQSVLIRQIRGSEGRCEDFDVNFAPLKTHTRERWLRIAVARQAGAQMPPVKLIRIGDVYFVRDGHHRISVARALGQKEIEAEVTVWQIAGTPPWKPHAQSCDWMNQSMGQACIQKAAAVRLA